MGRELKVKITDINDVDLLFIVAISPLATGTTTLAAKHQTVREET